MDTREQVQNFCRKCTKRKFDASKGIICSLTFEKPDFEHSCNDYVEDEEAARQIVDATEEVFLSGFRIRTTRAKAERLRGEQKYGQAIMDLWLFSFL